MAKKEDILKKVRQYNRVNHKRNVFVAGKTLVPISGRVWDEEEVGNLVSASLDFWLTAGPWAQQCEEALANYVGVKYCSLVNSGSSANLLAVTALTSPKLGRRRLSPGDEIITVAGGFPTTLNPIIQNSLIPVFVDMDLDTLSAKMSDVERALSKKTKAIFLPHTLGNPFDISTALEIAKKNNLWLIEDNCDALGSRYKKRLTGSFAHMSTSSFYPAHHITMGEGGAVFTQDERLKDIVLSFRDWGRDCWCLPGKSNTCKKRFGWKLGDLPEGYDHKYIYSHIGYNLKITDLQAAIGVAQVKKLPGFILKRERNFNALYDGLKPYEEFLHLPKAQNQSEPCWFGFPLRRKKSAPFNRSDIVSFLENRKIETRMLFGGNLLRQPAYRKIRSRQVGRLQNSDLAMKEVFWIGVYPGLSSDMIDFVLETFKTFFRKRL